MAVSPFGNKTASELIKVLFKSTASKIIVSEGAAEVKFNFL